MLQGKWNDLSEVLETAVDSGVVHNDQRAIWTTWRVSMEALDEIFEEGNLRCGDAWGRRSTGMCYEACCE